MFHTFTLVYTDQITMNIDRDDGMVGVGNAAEPSLDVGAAGKVSSFSSV